MEEHFQSFCGTRKNKLARAFLWFYTKLINLHGPSENPCKYSNSHISGFGEEGVGGFCSPVA